MVIWKTSKTASITKHMLIFNQLHWSMPHFLAGLVSTSSPDGAFSGLVAPALDVLEVCQSFV